MNKMKAPGTIPPINIDGIKLTLKKASVDAFLTAVEERNEFVSRRFSGTYPLRRARFFDSLCRKEEEKALDLYAESGENISHFTFMYLASACYDVLGPVVEVEEKYCKLLQLLDIEVTE